MKKGRSARLAYIASSSIIIRILCFAAFTSIYSMDYRELCKTIAGMHSNVEVVMVLSNSKLTASHVKSGGPVPDEDEFHYMISQIEMIVKATKANEDKFGKMGFITIHYKYIDGMFFPLDDHDTLIVGVIQPYNHDVFSDKVLTLLAARSKVGRG